MTALVVDTSGRVRAIYSEAVDFELLGKVAIKRASHVEPDESGRWWADLSPVAGPKLGPFTVRSAALQAELRWLSDRLAALPID